MGNDWDTRPTTEEVTMDTRGMRREDLHALWQRLLRVARLDATAFLEVRNDPAATWPAVIVVGVASVLSALGGLLLYIVLEPAQLRDSTRFFIQSVIVGSIVEIALWFVWVYVTLLMLQQLWKRRVAFASLVRTMGLAYFPVALSFFIFVKPITLPIALISLAAAVLLSGVAVEASTEAEPAEILFANLAGFAVFAIVLGLLGYYGSPFPYTPGIFAAGI